MRQSRNKTRGNGTLIRMNLFRVGLPALLVTWSSLFADFEQALVFYRDGEVSAARKEIEGLCGDSAEPRVRLLCAALSTDAEVARQLSRGLIDDPDASDTIQAQAHLLLGDHLTAEKSHTRAAFHYSRSAQLLTEGIYKYASALVRAGNADSAVSLLHEGTTNPLTDPERSYYLGIALLADSLYSQAVEAFKAAMKRPEDAWYEAAAGGAYAAAVELGHTEEAERLSTLLEKHGPYLLDRRAQKHRIQTRAKAPKETRTTNPSGRSRYSLQVGAFSSAENAESYRIELKKTFGTVRILEAESGGTVLHKVRVGLFDSEEGALAFGEKQLRPRDILFRVVAE